MSDTTHIGTSAADLRSRIRFAAARILAESSAVTAVSVEDVCSTLGIDTDTFTTEYPDSYELYREVIFQTTDNMLKATDALTSSDARQSRTIVARIIEECTRVAVAERATAGLYRSEYRYLRRDDADTLSRNLTTLRRRIAEPLMLHRPRLSTHEADILAAAALSAISSITVHPTDLPGPKLQTLLSVTALRLLDSEPATTEPSEALPASARWSRDTSTPEGRLRAAAIDLCFERGIRRVTLDEVAAIAGVDTMTARALYPTLSRLLGEACVQGHEALAAATHDAIAASTTPRDTLALLSGMFVEHYVADYKVITLFFSDGRHLSPDIRARMVELQTTAMDAWSSTLREVRPELSDVEARFLIFAALNLVGDLGRHLNWQFHRADMRRMEKCANVVMALIR